MWPTLTLVFAAAALFFLVRSRYLSQVIRDFTSSVQDRQTFLLSRQPGLARLFQVDRLQTAINDLLRENARRAESERALLRQIELTLTSLPEAVVVIDQQNRVALANDRFRQTFNFGEEATGKRLESLLPSAELLLYIQEVRRNRSVAKQEIEIILGQQAFWLELSGAPFPSIRGEPSFALFILHDVSRLKRLEKVRTEFVANVSHELRTPLTILKGFADTLVDDHATLPEEERARFLTKIQRHVQRLNHLVEDLLILSRLESGSFPLNVSNESLPEIAAEIMEDLRHRPEAEPHRLIVRPAGDLELESVPLDRVRIGQVLQNLLDNACKYCREPAEIRVEFERLHRRAICRVIDTGPGIPPRDLPHVFERFYRVEKGRGRDQGGTGLGLAIVKHIVQQHGGTVYCRSLLGRGSTFEFTLPLDLLEMPEAARKGARRKAASAGTPSA